MKIIVCGAGRIGKSMVGYLSHGNNDISVIDTDRRRLDEISKEWDVMTVIGNAAHPDILEKSGAENADLILAVTNNDEVNMIACQVADYLFNVRKKISRIDSTAYLNPLWCPLYNEHHIAIDLLISPDVEVAEAIYNIIKIPGTTSVMSFMDKKLYLLSIRCPESCPLLRIPLANIEMAAPDLKMVPVCVVRNNKSFIPNNEFSLEAEDEIFFLVEEKEIDDAIHAFGMDRPSNEKIIIFGGNQIAFLLAQKLEEDDNITSCKIIDEDVESSKRLAMRLNNTTVINGEMLSDAILEDSGIDTVDVTVSVTLKDKDNLLASLIARKSGARSTISLVNSKAYNNLVSNVSDSVIVDNSTVTVSGILKELRKSKITKAYSLGRGFGEIWELKIDEDSLIAGKKIIELELPENSKICAICRDDEIICPTIYDRLQEGDIIILFSSSRAIKKVEKIFA